MRRNSSRSAFTPVIDLICLIVIALPSIYLHFRGTPYERGFFCNDLSLRHPFKNSTISTSVVLGVEVGVPFLVFIPTEVILARGRSSSVLLMGKRIPLWIINSYKSIGVYLFGGLATLLVTDIGKYSIGRLRPHFMDLCRPNVNCANLSRLTEYIIDFSCQGGTEHFRKEVRLSFPSGHSSCSAYVMVYLSLYVQGKMTWNGSFLLKRVIQLCLISMAWGIGLSRVSDYKHHWSDVLVGLTIGTISAILTGVFISKCIYEKFEVLKLSSNNLVDSRSSMQF